MNAFRFKRGLDRAAVRDERAEPDAQGRAASRRTCSSRAACASTTVLPELERRLELVGLSPDVLGMYPIELSGGMKQRSVMVLSTLLDPSLLIADEITSALDVSTQRPSPRRSSSSATASSSRA